MAGASAGQPFFFSASLEIKLHMRGRLEHEIGRTACFQCPQNDYIDLNSFRYVRIVATTSLPSAPAVTT